MEEKTGIRPCQTGEPGCREAVYSEDYYDLIIDYNGIVEYLIPACVQNINAYYDIGYYPRENLPLLNLQDYMYMGIPKCYTLADKSALEASNILILQNQPALDLKGRGVLVGFVDTGIDYTNPLFRKSDGTTRIKGIWDQTRPEGESPEGFLYGTLYTEEMINRALASPEPMEAVPSGDEIGHGTFLAGVTAGGENAENNFIGAVPEASIAVVKCKQAKEYLREFYFIPEDAPCYQENDLMSGVAWLNALADALEMPLVVCIAMGSNMGPHDGSGPLSVYLNDIGLRRRRVVSIAAGNEASARHHYRGSGIRQGNEEDVEISVGKGVRGFTMEFWAVAPELYQITILSPTGELLPVSAGQIGGRDEYLFLFENTTVSVDYGIVGVRNANQLIFIRMENPLEGIWTLRVTAKQVIGGEYHIWLPVPEFFFGDVFFLRSHPDTTATAPSYSPSAITLGAYQASGESLYPDSGRGYGINGIIKPDLAAPGVDIQGPGQRGLFVAETGTSAAAAVAAGACAQLLQWGIVDGNYPSLNSTEIKNILIRGARRSPERNYPNREWGYGILDVYEALNRLRNLD